MFSRLEPVDQVDDVRMVQFLQRVHGVLLPGLGQHQRLRYDLSASSSRQSCSLSRQRSGLKERWAHLDGHVDRRVMFFPMALADLSKRAAPCPHPPQSMSASHSRLRIL